MSTIVITAVSILGYFFKFTSRDPDTPKPKVTGQCYQCDTEGGADSRNDDDTRGDGNERVFLRCVI